MDLFELLKPVTRDRLNLLAERLEISSGEYLIRRGDKSGDVFRLVEGRLEIVDSRARPEVIIRVLGPGAVVGEISFLRGGVGVRTADVRVGQPAVIFRWDQDVLQDALNGDEGLAADFFFCISQVLADRLDALTSVAARGGLGALDDGLSDDVAALARGVCEPIRKRFRVLEARAASKGDIHGAEGAVRAAFVDLAARVRALMGELETAEREAVSEILSQELHPYLVRSKMGEQTLATRVGDTSRAPMLAHVALGRARGTDALGALIDQVVLMMPTSVAFRERAVAAARLALRSVPVTRPGDLRVLVVGAGTGALVATLGKPIVERGGELTCLDNDREALAFLQSGTAVRALNLNLRLIHTDLSAFVQGRSELYLGPQHLVVVDELLEYLPDRVIATLASVVLSLLRPGCRALFSFLGPTTDSVVFEHLLRWPTVRRPPEVIIELLSGVGFVDVEIAWEQDGGLVAVGVRG